MRVKATVISVVALLVLAACGGGSETDAAKTASTSGASTSQTTASTATPAAGQLEGTWTGTYTSKKFSSTSGGFTVVFTQSGTELSGTITLEAGCVTSGTLSGTVTGDTIDFGAVKGQGRTVSFTGSVDGDQMKGTYDSDASCGNDNGTWTASRS